AHGRDPPQPLRAASLDRDVALQGVRRGAARDLRGPLRHRGAEGDAALAHEARGGCEGADGRRLLALRLRAQPRHARDLPALPPRAGPLEAAAPARGALRARDARELQDLTMAE